ncbi:MAG: preprotein translocase subunit SecG [Lachnospiraceae bacterium]|jgi:preprotein translocase subunit SecG|nr:preprotein translocase subunit SecG [Lachnospiraceae bacterium]
MKLALQIALMVVCVLLVVIVLLQEGKDAGFGGGAFTGQAGDTYYSKNKRHTVEGKLEIATVVLGILFFVIAMSLNMSFLN